MIVLYRGNRYQSDHLLIKSTDALSENLEKSMLNNLQEKDHAIGGTFTYDFNNISLSTSCICPIILISVLQMEKIFKTALHHSLKKHVNSYEG